VDISTLFWRSRRVEVASNGILDNADLLFRISPELLEKIGLQANPASRD
jgi:hypothetical protein